MREQIHRFLTGAGQRGRPDPRDSASLSRQLFTRAAQRMNGLIWQQMPAENLLTEALAPDLEYIAMLEQQIPGLLDGLQSQLGIFRDRIASKSTRAEEVGLPKANQAGNESRAQEWSQEVTGMNKRTDRQKAVDAYIEEVSKKKRITRTDIWKSARYKTRTEFERWESYWYEKHGRKPNKTADERFTGILTEKPHLT